MDLISGYPYFLLKNGLRQVYERLASDHSTDIVILGGGISGAIMAHELLKQDIKCTIIDGRPIGLGSTCANTSLLQYEIDTSLHELSQKIGTRNAIKAYWSCDDAIDKIQSIAQEAGYEGFVNCESLYFSPTKKQIPFIKKEFQARKDAGFKVQLLSKTDTKKKFGLDAPVSILSSHAAKIDAYSFIHSLHKHNMSKGLKIYEDTFVKSIKHLKSGVILKTEKGFTIKAKKLIYANGYEGALYINEPILKLKSTYVNISKPIKDIPTFFKNTLFWNTNDPYLYLREIDGRIIVGGRDEDFYDPVKRDKLLPSKAEKLKRDFKKLYPKIDFETQFYWTGTFGSTKDGLPYIGCYEKKPNSYFALGYGGNGITFCALAAELIVKLLKNKSFRVPDYFSFNR